MPTRNTPVLQQIIETIGDLCPTPEEALSRLERHFESTLLIVAGNVSEVVSKERGEFRGARNSFL